MTTGATLPGGWHFYQPLRSGQLVKVEGQGYEDLESRVLEFRLRQLDLVPPNTSTREDVRDDIKSYVRDKFPRWCVDGGTSPAAPASPPQAHVGFLPLINRVSDWFQGLAYRTLEFVDAAESNRRAGICVHCPHNLRWQTSCSPCNQGVQRQAFIANAGRRTQNEAHLNACRAFGDYLPTAVWLKDAFSQAKHDPPIFCWRR